MPAYVQNTEICLKWLHRSFSPFQEDFPGLPGSSGKASAPAPIQPYRPATAPAAAKQKADKTANNKKPALGAKDEFPGLPTPTKSKKSKPGSVWILCQFI